MRVIIAYAADAVEAGSCWSAPVRGPRPRGHLGIVARPCSAFLLQLCVCVKKRRKNKKLDFIVLLCAVHCTNYTRTTPRTGSLSDPPLTVYETRRRCVYVYESKAKKKKHPSSGATETGKAFDCPEKMRGVARFGKGREAELHELARKKFRF